MCLRGDLATERHALPLCNRCVRCSRRAGWGATHGKPTRCKAHRAAGSIQARRARCTFLQGCARRPIFGAPDAGPTFCAHHKQPGHAYLPSAPLGGPGQCAHVARCGRAPSHAEAGALAPLFCKGHKQPHHVDLRARRRPGAASSGGSEEGSLSEGGAWAAADGASSVSSAEDSMGLSLTRLGRDREGAATAARRRRMPRAAVSGHPCLMRDETCPVSTEGWTRRVHFVREGGGGGGHLARGAWGQPASGFPAQGGGFACGGVGGGGWGDGLLWHSRRMAQATAGEAATRFGLARGDAARARTVYALDARAARANGAWPVVGVVARPGMALRGGTQAGLGPGDAAGGGVIVYTGQGAVR